ncbi:hypothetical protein GE061_015088 [Apolygus lucorum]|uniref:MICOS complex subunit MIC60 n=1 Tax=Apolygus lucorum TaxID=248454 RepID=A0A8S9XM29_APOLU|nr:hypothetical protein GE061_015088 [Apolygus lucorum]
MRENEAQKRKETRDLEGKQGLEKDRGRKKVARESKEMRENEAQKRKETRDLEGEQGLEKDRGRKKVAREMKAECEQTTKQAIANQGISFEDDLANALAMKEKEVMRKLQREFEEKLLDQREKQRGEMAAILGRLKGMDDLMKERACEDSKSKNMWSATEALQAALTGTRDCLKMPLRPLDLEIHAIKNLVGDDDEFTLNVLDAVPRLAIDRGVYSIPALKERFLNVYRIARKVGFLPDGGASLPVMLIQMLKAILVINPSNPIPCYEMLNEPFDPEGLDNFEILQRCKYYMDKGDWYMVLGYLNLLKGASRAVAQDYINELKLFLEMKLIADSLLFNASAEYLAVKKTFFLFMLYIFGRRNK